MNKDLVLLIKCPSHPARPDGTCDRCYHAVNCNRMNNGWGARYAWTPEGVLVSWQTYEPRMSWFGPDAFMGVTLREGWTGE
jgi:hypothetical protein